MLLKWRNPCVGLHYLSFFFFFCRYSFVTRPICREMILRDEHAIFLAKKFLKAISHKCDDGFPFLNVDIREKCLCKDKTPLIRTLSVKLASTQIYDQLLLTLDSSKWHAKNNSGSIHTSAPCHVSVAGCRNFWACWSEQIEVVIDGQQSSVPVAHALYPSRYNENIRTSRAWQPSNMYALVSVRSWRDAPFRRISRRWGGHGLSIAIGLQKNIFQRSLVGWPAHSQ